MPRRVIRNAIQLEALPAVIKAAKTKTAKTTKPRTKTTKKPKPPVVYIHPRRLDGESYPEAAARLQHALHADLATAGLSHWQPEYQFAKAALGRKWAIDMAWVDERIALELEGRGSHQRSRYFTDMEKYNQLAVMGWLLIRVTYDMIADGRAQQIIRAAFALREGAAA